MNNKRKWELTEEEKASFNTKTKEILNDAEKLNIYNRFVEQQKDNFIAIIENVNEIINKLKDKRMISEYVQFRARIKAPESAIQNDETKALDDIFGMEIITGTDAEIEVIKRQLEKYMNILREKNHNKPNGYKAKHFSYSVKSQILKKIGIDENKIEYMPIIECQMKTLKVYIECNGGTVDHTTEYKKMSKQEVQKQYNNGRL